MPCGEVNFDITPQPEKHMFECQYITMVAVMLAFPMWRKPPYVPGDWPPPDEVERARHGLEKQLIQFNVGPSVMDDELGLSYETLAISGLYLASEPEFLDTLRHRCLMCGKAFFTQWKFVDHLQQHNFCQLDTYMCYHRLQLRSLETVGHPCHFCAQFEHATSLGKICVPRLHLAIFLCNGSPGLPSRRNLEGCLDPRSDGCTVDQHTGLPAAQASQGRQASAKEDIRFFFRRSSTTGCQIGPEDGRHLESGASGASVCDASAAGSGQHLSHSPGSITEVAQGGEDDAPQTAVVIHAGPDVACQSGDPGEHPADGATLGDMPEQGIDRQPGCNALSEVDEKAKKLEPSKEPGIQIKEIANNLQQLNRLVQDPMTTLRFHSLVKKTEESDRAVPWLWLLSNRHNSEAWHLLRRLCYYAFWLLIGVQIRPQGTDRTQLAKGIQKALSKGQSSS